MKIKSTSYLLFLLFFMFACVDSSETADSVEGKDVQPNIVRIATNVMDFVISDTIKSGWNQFVYKNLSQHPHFFLIEDYPDGKTLDTARQRVIVPFQNGMNKIMEGKAEEAGAEFAKLPKWYSEVQLIGGSGIVSPGQTASTYLRLLPGNYFIECYMKMEGGIFHSAAGMIKEIVVVKDEENERIEPPLANGEVSISGEEGITYSESILEGNTIFKVLFKDQMSHEHFIGHDINLVELSADADLKELEAWMNWANPQGLLLLPPDGVTFLGGVNETPIDSFAYFSVNLLAGRKYAFISEVPNSIEKNMLQVFEVK